MNELVTDIKSLEIDTLKNLKNSKADNTLRAYKADFNDFMRFCSTNDFSSLPTNPKIIAFYLKLANNKSVPPIYSHGNHIFSKKG